MEISCTKKLSINLPNIRFGWHVFDKDKHRSRKQKLTERWHWLFFFLSMRRFCSWIWFSLGATNTLNKMPILFIKMRANCFRREAFDVRIEMHLKLLHFLLPDLSCVFFFWKYIPYRKYWALLYGGCLNEWTGFWFFFGDCFLFRLVHKVVGIICLVSVDALKEWMRLVWLLFSDWSNVWLLLVNLINPVKTLYTMMTVRANDRCLSSAVTKKILCRSEMKCARPNEP